MSFLKRLFGGGAPSQPAEPPRTIEHKGFVVRALPFESGGRFQTAGSIEKVVDGVRKEHQFIRADSHASMEQAIEFSLMKGCQIIDQVGDGVFAERK
jgi:hypothetical protein